MKITFLIKNSIITKKHFTSKTISRPSPGVEEEEYSSYPFKDKEVPRDSVLLTDKLIPPQEIIFEMFEEKKWTSITLCIEVTEE